jgi:hypothetical protein|tara:strand:+ start:267 stop:1292 length:1026 start_codon:yes stop_codon:yes gene_type:complete
MAHRRDLQYSVDPRLTILLSQAGGFAQLSTKWRKIARGWGYIETNSLGRQYVPGRRASAEAMQLLERNMKLQGYDVRNDGWTKEARASCRQQGYYPGTLQTYFANDYSDYRGSEPEMDDNFVDWLRNWCVTNVEATLQVVRSAILLHHGVLLSVGCVHAYKRRAGISTQVIQRIAAQRDTPANLRYAHHFLHKLQQYKHPAFYDESGISRDGLQSRRNRGMGIRGAGGAILRETLKYPPSNLSVLAFLDKGGMFGVETFSGGTDTVRVDSYFQRHAISLAVRGVDVVILDNCPSHRVHSLALWLRAVGIEVLFLPRYWPQWNPIEVSDICFVVFIFVSLHR